MRIPTSRIALGLLAVCLLVGPPAGADSWMPPVPQRRVAPDGGTYLLLVPGNNTDAAFQLVRRTSRRPPAGESVRVEAGDVVLASGTCTMPMEAWCLSKAEGFVLLETYGAVGHGAVAALYDGEGRRRWQRTLADLFTPEERGGFRNTAGSIWWYETAWLDAEAGDLVVVYETPLPFPDDLEIAGPNAGPPRAPGVLRIKISDGTPRRADSADLMAGLEQGSVENRLKVLSALGRARPAGWEQRLGALLADEASPPRLRVTAAVGLRRAGDDRGHAYVEAVARSKTPADARALALRHLQLFLGKEALPVLRAALKDEQRETGLAIYIALQDFRVEALEMLISMLSEEDASLAYRRAAIGLISQLGRAGRPALGALRKVAEHAPKELAEEARYALVALERAR